MTSKDTQQRLRILQFFETHGLAATVDAFGVSRRTLYRWKRALREGGGNPAALAAKSCAPKRKRTPKPDPRVIAEIRRRRYLHPNLGKAKLHALLKPWCAAQDLALPSVSTIGRIIARAPDKMRHTPCRLDPRGRPKPFRRPVKPRRPKGVQLKPLQVLACDTIKRIRDGLRRYLVTFTDPASRLAFAFALPSKHARHTARAMEQVLTLWPHAPHTMLSDNGSEFEADFAKTLQQYLIRRWYTYPKSPKMNAHAERFNRTLQESFVNYHEALLFTDIHLFNQKLADWLIFYNTESPHHSLGLQSPVSFLIQHQPECQRYWTHTPYFTKGQFLLISPRSSPQIH
jgi:transposase InsO family protein